MMTRQNPFKKRSVNIYLAQLKFGLLVAAVMTVILLLTSCTEEVSTDPLQAEWYFVSGQTPIYFKFDVSKSATGYTAGNVILNYHEIRPGQPNLKRHETDVAVAIGMFENDTTINRLDLYAKDFHIELTNLIVKDTTIKTSTAMAYVQRWVKIKEMRFTIPGSGAETVLKKQYISRVLK
jgi:hypothetical protein